MIQWVRLCIKYQHICEDFGEGTLCAYRAYAQTSAFYHARSVPGCSIFTKQTHAHTKRYHAPHIFILQRESSLIRVSSTTPWHGPAILPRSSFPWPSWPRMNSCFLILKLSRSKAPNFRRLTTPYDGITTIIIKPTEFTHFSFHYTNNLRLILQLGPLVASKGQRWTASKEHQCTSYCGEALSLGASTRCFFSSEVSVISVPGSCSAAQGNTYGLNMTKG